MENNVLKTQSASKEGVLFSESESGVDISLIVACYNEQPHLEKNLNFLKEVLDKSRYEYEIIIIDDASTDQTRIIAEDFVKNNPEIGDRLKIFAHPKNLGRGRTVSDGIMAARGRIVGFVDVDFSTNPWYLFPLVSEIEKGADVVLGSRVYKLKPAIFHRWILSKGYKILAKFFLNVDLGDTETGCKFFNRKKILPILKEVKDERWFWDTEIIARSHLAGLKITELPTVFVRESLYTTVKVFRDSLRHFVCLLKLSREMGRLRKNK